MLLFVVEGESGSALINAHGRKQVYEQNDAVREQNEAVRANDVTEDGRVSLLLVF